MKNLVTTYIKNLREDELNEKFVPKGNKDRQSNSKQVRKVRFHQLEY